MVIRFPKFLVLLGLLGLSISFPFQARAHPGHGEKTAHVHVGRYHVRLCDGRVVRSDKPQLLLSRNCGKTCKVVKKQRTLRAS
jgi:hypothetical protein